MSMISSQCDELRKAADELQGYEGNIHNFTWSGFYSTSHYVQQVLHSAADTIWELSCKLASVVDQSDEMDRLKSENLWLREMLSESRQANEHLHAKLIRRTPPGVREQSFEIARLKNDNAKLRDAMYAHAKRHALQHMDADELRIWASHQAELIEKLRKVTRDMWYFGFSSNSGANSHEEYLKQEEKLHDRLLELGVLDE